MPEGKDQGNIGQFKQQVAFMRYKVKQNSIFDVKCTKMKTLEAKKTTTILIAQTWLSESVKKKSIEISE